MVTRDHPKIEMANADGTDRQVSLKIIRQKTKQKTITHRLKNEQ